MQSPEDFQAEMRLEFIDSALDELYTLDESLKHFSKNNGDGVELLSQLRRTAHSLKGRGGIFDFPLITVIAHRFEDFMTEMLEVKRESVDDIQLFIDRMHELLDTNSPSASETASKIVRALPARCGGFDPSTITKLDIEVLLVMPKSTATHYVQRELHACGYRVTTLTSPFSAFEFIVRTKPDLVIINLTMEAISGVDLANAIRTMDVTCDTPVALLTAMERSANDFKTLHPDVPVIRKGNDFGDDLAVALYKLNIT